jgi:hypothetical protein
MILRPPPGGISTSTPSSGSDPTGRAGRGLRQPCTRIPPRAPAAGGGAASSGSSSRGGLAARPLDARPAAPRTRCRALRRDTATSCASTTSPSRSATGSAPGGLADATDRAQLADALHARRAHRARVRKGCQVMIEGPGTSPSTRSSYNVKARRPPLHGAPFYVLGPLGGLTCSRATTTSRARSAGDRCRVQRGGHALLRHAPGAPSASPPARGRQAGLHRLQDSPRTPPTSRSASPVAARTGTDGAHAGPRRARLGAALGFSSLRPRSGAAYHDEDLQERTDYCAMCVGTTGAPSASRGTYAGSRAPRSPRVAARAAAGTRSAPPRCPRTDGVRPRVPGGPRRRKPLRGGGPRAHARCTPRSPSDLPRAAGRGAAAARGAWPSTAVPSTGSPRAPPTLSRRARRRFDARSPAITLRGGPVRVKLILPAAHRGDRAAHTGRSSTRCSRRSG